MRGNIYITGIIGEDVTLDDIRRQVKAQSKATEYLVRIDSVGGLVKTGFEIYSYLKNLDKPITTYTTKAFSIASVIFLAGEKRIIPEDSIKAVMIHLPWAKVQGTAEVIESHAMQMRKLESEFFQFYSEALNIDETTIESLLTQETYLDASQALEMGFATEIQVTPKAVAMLNNENKEDKSLMNKLQKQIAALYNQAFSIKAELVLQDATAAELVFPDLADGDMPEVGAKATVDGKPAEGEFLMPDGSKLVFEAGELKEILPAEEAPAGEDAENAAGDELPAEEEAPADDKDELIAELQAEIEALKSKIAELEGGQADAEAKEDEQAEKMVAILAKVLEKSDEQEVRYQALAKQIGSNFQPDTKKENTPAVKASAENKSRAWQILNS
jgi:ATP-dependent protease ClpP protease subunit